MHLAPLCGSPAGIQEPTDFRALADLIWDAACLVAVAAAWAADGIRVNAIAPGWIATDLTRALQEDEARTQAILSRTPIKRWGQPDDLAGVVAFLASDAAKFVTGVVMPIDGGYLTL